MAGRLIRVAPRQTYRFTGLATGSSLVAVNGESYTPELLKRAIKRASQEGEGSLELLIKSASRYRTVRVEYRE